MNHIVSLIITALVLSALRACGEIPQDKPPTTAESEPSTVRTIAESTAEPETSTGSTADTETTAVSTTAEPETSADVPETTAQESTQVGTEEVWFDAEPPLSEAIMTLLAVPDFLDEDQQLLYRRARSIFVAFNGYPEMVEEYPCENVLGIPYEERSVYIPSGDYQEHYIRACGRYQKWDDFYAMGVSIFTDDYFTRLSRNFLNIDGNTYFLDAAKGGAFGYMPELTPDTFELVSKTDSEIEFNVIGHYYLTWNPETADPSTITTQSFPIKMELTDNGWRFSLFNSPG